MYLLSYGGIPTAEGGDPAIQPITLQDIYHDLITEQTSNNKMFIWGDSNSIVGRVDMQRHEIDFYLLGGDRHQVCGGSSFPDLLKNLRFAIFFRRNWWYWRRVMRLTEIPACFRKQGSRTRSIQPQH